MIYQKIFQTKAKYAQRISEVILLGFILGDPGATSRDDAINIFGRKFISRAEEPLALEVNSLPKISHRPG